MRGISRREILAAADAMMVSVLDGLAANAPGVLLTCDPVLAAKVTVENVDGKIWGYRVYAMCAHMISGSVTVKPGDKVTEGRVLGRLRPSLLEAIRCRTN